MSQTHTVAESRAYHHGDLRRGLIDAAQAILEREGPTGLSLRAVAREAGVSPAAPYHHFKDKGQLLQAVAEEGWARLNETLAEAKAGPAGPEGVSVALGVAYVRFARENPALYRVMYDSSRDREQLPFQLDEDQSAYWRTRKALVEAGADPTDVTGLELATIAAWCVAHGLAELVGFAQFRRLKEELGGEEAFLRGVFQHLGVFAKGIGR